MLRAADSGVSRVEMVCLYQRFTGQYIAQLEFLPEPFTPYLLPREHNHPSPSKSTLFPQSSQSPSPSPYPHAYPSRPLAYSNSTPDQTYYTAMTTGASGLNESSGAPSVARGNYQPQALEPESRPRLVQGGSGMQIPPSIFSEDVVSVTSAPPAYTTM